MTQSAEDRVPVLLRFPKALLAQLDEFAERTAPKNRPVSRTATVMTLLEDALHEKTRQRKAAR